MAKTVSTSRRRRRYSGWWHAPHAPRLVGRLPPPSGHRRHEVPARAGSRRTAAFRRVLGGRRRGRRAVAIAARRALAARRRRAPQPSWRRRCIFNTCFSAVHGLLERQHCNCSTVPAPPCAGRASGATYGFAHRAPHAMWHINSCIIFDSKRAGMSHATCGAMWPELAGSSGQPSAQMAARSVSQDRAAPETAHDLVFHLCF